MTRYWLDQEYVKGTIGVITFFTGQLKSEQIKAIFKSGVCVYRVDSRMYAADKDCCKCYSCL